MLPTFASVMLFIFGLGLTFLGIRSHANSGRNKIAAIVIGALCVIFSAIYLFKIFSSGYY
jgi:hypothetical protein